MKKIVSYLILSLILISCVNKNGGVKIIRPVKEDSPLMGRLNFIKEGQAASIDTLLNGVKNILNEDKNYTSERPRTFDYMLYINPKGKIDNLVVLESTSKKVDNYISKKIGNWKLSTLLENKPINSRYDFKIVAARKGGTYNIYLANNNAVIRKHLFDNLDKTYFVAVEQMPSPIGGLQGIQEKIVYPEIAKRAGVQGRVFIKAYINEKGDVDKAEVIKGIGAGCDKAAIKAVKETKFVPGRQRGKPVKVQVSIPIYFKLDGAENSSNIHFLLKRAKNEKKSETATITGRVFNSEKNESILGANIILKKVFNFQKNTKIGAATDENGNYLITNIQPGQYNLMFTKYPYKSESKKFTFKPGFKYVIDIIVKK